MMPVSQAQAIVQSLCARLPAETLPFAALNDRVLAADLLSPVNLPPFDNSAMDGFALRTAGRELPIGSEFDVGGEQAAGAESLSAEGDDAWEIMTGARLPNGLDAVIPVEQVEVLSRREDGRPMRFRLRALVRPGADIRHAGEDIAMGAPAIGAGTRISAQELMVLAGLGIAELSVVRRPKVAVICTGRELVDDPLHTLAPGQIRNSNGPFLKARLRQAGADLVLIETVPDEAEDFKSALARALRAGADMVISTGAVSMGRYDFVPQALQDVGAEIAFHKLRMRPGKPLLFARLPLGQLFFGLPGNPISSAVGLRFFVELAIRRQLGLPTEVPWRLPLAHAVVKKPGFQLHQKARLQLSGDARLSVVLLKGQESFKTWPMIDANAWAVLPDDAEHLSAGTLVDVYALGHEQAGILGVQSNEA